MGTCFPAFVQTPPSSIMLTIPRSAVIGSAMLALASAESLSPPFLQTALEVVSRASSSSEVLSLNLTNLIILLALKVAIVAFGLFSGGATGRSGADSEISQAVPFTAKYQTIMETVYDASEYAKNGGECSA